MTPTRPRSTSPVAGEWGSACGPDFSLDHAELAAAFTERTKATVDQLPAQPDRCCAGPADLAEIARLATLHDAGDL